MWVAVRRLFGGALQKADKDKRSEKVFAPVGRLNPIPRRSEYW
jgi:hypothetical protein